MKSIKEFLVGKGVKSNKKKITIYQMIKWVNEWNLGTPTKIAE